MPHPREIDGANIENWNFTGKSSFVYHDGEKITSFVFVGRFVGAPAFGLIVIIAIISFRRTDNKCLIWYIQDIL